MSEHKRIQTQSGLFQFVDAEPLYALIDIHTGEFENIVTYRKTGTLEECIAALAAKVDFDDIKPANVDYQMKRFAIVCWPTVRGYRVQESFG